jgi:hypothetical protein
VVLAGFMRILKPRFIEAFAGKIINLHPSLLPSFPGLDGIGQAWRRGVKVTGCTVHYVTPEVDGGPIIDQAALFAREGESYEVRSWGKRLREAVVRDAHEAAARVVDGADAEGFVHVRVEAAVEDGHVEVDDVAVGDGPSDIESVGVGGAVGAAGPVGRPVGNPDDDGEADRVVLVFPDDVAQRDTAPDAVTRRLDAVATDETEKERVVALDGDAPGDEVWVALTRAESVARSDADAEADTESEAVASADARADGDSDAAAVLDALPRGDADVDGDGVAVVLTAPVLLTDTDTDAARD